MTHEWRNWTGDQACAPAAIQHPRTLDGLIYSVRSAAERGLAIHAAGSGHSFTDAALTDGVMIRIEALNRILDLDRESGLIKVEAGITLAELGRALWEHGLAMENLGDIDKQTLAGAISTATHGTGAGIPKPLGAGRGARVGAGRRKRARGLRAIRPDRVSGRAGGRRGARGHLLGHPPRRPGVRDGRIDSPKPLEWTLSSIDELAARNEHFEFYVFPHTDTALVIERNRTEGPPRPRSRARAFLNEILIENYGMDLLSRVGRSFPSSIPRLVGFAADQFSRTRRTDRSYRIFASDRRVRFTEMEYASRATTGPMPCGRCSPCFESGRFPVGFPIEFRLVAPDDAFLSTAHERETAYVAVHQYRGAPWEPYFRAVEEIMDSYEGRPHWGKRHFQTAETLAPRYPRWRDFQKVRKRLDPDGRFSNSYTDRVLGPVGT